MLMKLLNCLNKQHRFNAVVDISYFESSDDTAPLSADTCDDTSLLFPLF